MINKLFLFLFTLCSLVTSQQWQNYTTVNSGLAHNSVNAVLISRDGLKWFATDEGMSVFDGEFWFTLTVQNGLTANSINDLALIPADVSYYTIWMATDSGVAELEIHAFDDIRFSESYDSSTSDLISNHVRAVAFDTNYFAWFGTQNGVSVVTDQAWFPLTEEDYLNSNHITDIEADQTGLMHIATKGGGVSRLRMDKVDGITSASTINYWSSMPVDTVYTIYIDSNNVQWYGNREGLFRHEGIDSRMNWNVFRTTNGLIDNHVQTITGDFSGGLWIGTSSGASCYDGESFSNYTRTDGLISNNIHDIAVDRDGDVWFATDAGVSRFRKTSALSDQGTIPGSYALSNFPNPFNHGTILQFCSAAPGYADLLVVSTSGKRVLNMTGQYFSAGMHRIRWNATDESGHPLPSGVYLAVMSVSGKTLNRKLIHLK